MGASLSLKGHPWKPLEAPMGAKISWNPLDGRPVKSMKFRKSTKIPGIFPFFVRFLNSGPNSPTRGAPRLRFFPWNLTKLRMIPTRPQTSRMDPSARFSAHPKSTKRSLKGPCNQGCTASQRSPTGGPHHSKFSLRGCTAILELNETQNHPRSGIPRGTTSIHLLIRESGISGMRG